MVKNPQTFVIEKTLRDKASESMYDFLVKIRLAGRVSYVEVTARDSAHARQLTRAQYGPGITILHSKRLGPSSRHR